MLVETTPPVNATITDHKPSTVNLEIFARALFFAKLS